MVSKLVKTLDEVGYGVVGPLLEPLLADRVRSRLLRMWEERETQPLPGDSESKRSFDRIRPEFARLHLEDAVFGYAALQADVARLGLEIIGDEVNLGWSQCYIKAGGGDPYTRIPWHQDAYYAVTEGKGYQVWIALEDLSARGGPLSFAVAPPDNAILTHRWSEELDFWECEPEPPYEELLLGRGQGVCFTTYNPHRSSTNYEDAPRVGLSLALAEPGVRLKQNGELVGDRIPLVRQGKPVFDLVLDFARNGNVEDTAHPGWGVIEEIAELWPGSRDNLKVALPRLVEAAQKGTEEEVGLAIGGLLTSHLRGKRVNGDLVSARYGVAELRRESGDMLAAGRVADALSLLYRLREVDPYDEYLLKMLPQVLEEASP